MSEEIKNEQDELEMVKEEVVIEPASEEIVEEVVEKEEALAEADVPTEDKVEEEGEVEDNSEVVEEPDAEAADKTVEESSEEETEEKSEDEESEAKEVLPDETPEDSPVETAEEEPTEEEKMRAELEALRAEKEEAEEVNSFMNVMESTEVQSQQVAANIKAGIEEVAKKYNIPTDISMEELEKQDPTKAQMAKEIMARANAALEQAKAQLNSVREDAARNIVFKRAAKILDTYEMSEDQKTIAAETFVTILNEVGVKDLAEDLKAKVKLAVAQARMDSPMVAKVAEVAQEILDESAPVKEEEETKTDTDMSHSDTSVSNELPPEIETEEKEVEEAKDEVPPTPKKDLSEYMEGASTSVQKVATVTVDNVLQQLEALPFRERTAFYKEHQDIIDQAMTLKRKDV